MLPFTTSHKAQRHLRSTVVQDAIKMLQQPVQAGAALLRTDPRVGARAAPTVCCGPVVDGYAFRSALP